MEQEEMAAALNEWMRRFTDEPERFEREFQTVAQFLAEKAEGKIPSYGVAGAQYMRQISAELSAQGAV